MSDILNGIIGSAFVIEEGVLVEYIGTAETIDIPCGVTAISDCVFWCNDNIRYVHLPKGLTFIGNAAFCSCPHLEEINFPRSLVYIGNDAFFACKKLTHLDFPDNLTTIGSNAFGRCYRIKTINLPKKLTWISDNSFHDCIMLKDICIDEDSEMFYIENGNLYKYDTGELIISAYRYTATNSEMSPSDRYLCSKEQQ